MLTPAYQHLKSELEAIREIHGENSEQYALKKQFIIDKLLQEPYDILLQLVGMKEDKLHEDFYIP